MGRIISITNRKGGTGKSTTTVNLSAEFATKGYNTLVIDLDTQGHSSLGLGCIPNKNTLSAHLLFSEKGFIIEEAVLKTKWSNLYLIPANMMFEHGNVSDNRILKDAILRSSLINRFDFILIDTPPSLDNLLLNALVASDYVLVTYIPHYLSMEGVKSLARVCFKVASTENPSLRLLGLVPVMVNHRIQQHKKVSDSLSFQFGKNRLFSGIRSDIKLVEAFEKHMPVKYYSSLSRGAIDYSILAEEVLKEIQRREESK
jgi:chromosome partitioning protein